MSETISKASVCEILADIYPTDGEKVVAVKEVDKAYEAIQQLPPEDVQPVTYCEDCQWRADVKDVNTGEIYHTCGVLGFIIPDGFACNQGKRKGADDERA